MRPVRPPAAIYSLEIFGGCARLSGAASQSGLRIVEPIELLRGQWFDVTKRPVLETLLRWIRSGTI
eukprot:8083640-Heterocapsa_arctica.AAC.1